MPAPCQIACKKIDPPAIGRNGYRGFLNKSEVLPKGFAPFGQRKLSCDILVEHDVAVKLRDGCVIYVDIYRPTDSGTKVPAIISWSPFGKKLNGIKFLEMMTSYNMGVPKGTLSGLEKFEGLDPAVYVEKGFAIVNADTRGVGDSDGMCVIMGTQEGEDGYDCVEAIAALPWCNGNVGLAGNSHLAIAQWFIAQQHPPHLKAIAPWEGCGDLFREQFVRGGIWAGNFFDHISGVMIQGRHGMEDFKEMYRRSGGVGNPYWYDKRPDMTKINIPAYVTASFNTPLHTMGSIRGFLEIDCEDKWLRISPYQEWHDIWAVPESTAELIAFFDRYLKGVENNWESTPHVRLSTLQFGTKPPILNETIESFPPPQTKDVPFYLHANSALSDRGPPGTGFFESYNSEDGNSSSRWVFKFDKPTRLCGVPKAVLYMSCDDLDDFDVYVLLRKLDKDGKPLLSLNCPWDNIQPNSPDEIPKEKQTDILLYMGPLGMLRASHREVDWSKSMHPNYPFHPHSKVDKVPRGQIVRLEIGMFATSILFEARESVQIEVTGQTPVIQSFQELAGQMANVDNRGYHKVHSSAEYPSYFSLPIFG